MLINHATKRNLPKSDKNPPLPRGLIISALATQRFGHRGARCSRRGGVLRRRSPRTHRAARREPRTRVGPCRRGRPATRGVVDVEHHRVGAGVRTSCVRAGCAELRRRADGSARRRRARIVRARGVRRASGARGRSGPDPRSACEEGEAESRAPASRGARRDLISSRPSIIYMGEARPAARYDRLEARAGRGEEEECRQERLWNRLFPLV